MGKKSFAGNKVDIRGVLAEPPPSAKAAAAPAWSRGAGAAAAAPPQPAAKAAAAAAPKAPGAPSGQWARGGPQGLAATATSLGAAAKPKFAPAARPAPVAKAPAPSLGLKRGAKGAPPPAFDAEDFPEAERPKGAAERAREEALEAAAASFPETATGEQGLSALCKAAGGPGDASDAKARLSAGLGWLLQCGLMEAPKEARDRMLDAGSLAIAEFAARAEPAAQIQQLLEEYFEAQQSKGKSTPQAVEVNGLVDAALYGALAARLEVGSQKRGSILMRLRSRLLKPATSEAVQRRLASALVPLLSGDEAAATEAHRVFVEALAAAQEPVRRGGALGVAAVVQASGGASAMRKLGVMEKVKELVAKEGKSCAGHRQGGVMCLEALADVLGKAFEPYALSTMPLLLQCCSDSAREVQLAGRRAAGRVVSQVSGGGMKLLVNPVLDGLKSKTWRTQLSAIELLKPIVSELVANAPKRLAAVMPKAVPALCEAAAGARSEIRDAAKQVLELIGESISHLDVRPQVPALIAALCDPSEGLVTRALDGLLSAVYTTPLDGSCCALVCPVVARALARGDGELRKKGLNFVRTLAQFAEGGSDELGPYIASFQAQLSALIADPTPAVRDAAATAVGVLASLQAGDEDGEAGWSGSLLARLRGPAEGAELEGAAQGLAEAMAAATPDRLEGLLDELVAAGPQLGPLTALAYLPRALAAAPTGASAVARALGPMGDALADDVEAVRETGRRGILAAVEAATDEARAAAVASRLEEVLRMSDSRARAAGAEIACELLPRRQCAGEARGSLVAALVLGQADAVAPARKAAEKAWRVATESAQGTPGKQLKDLRPRLLERLSSDACGADPAAAAHAGRAAAQLHQRLEAGGAGGVFDDLGPRIQEALESEDPAAQRSACSALAEALRAGGAGGGHKALREQGLVAAAREALCSGDEDVRAAAASCFATGPAGCFAEPLVLSLCAAEATPSPAELSGLRQLLSVDSSGAALSALVGRAGAAPHGAAQLACLAAASSAPAKAVQQAAAQVVAACIAVARAVAGQEEAAAAAAAEIAGRLDAAGVAEAAAAAVANIERGQGDVGSEAAAHVLRGLLEGGPAGDVDAEDTLDALLASALQGSGRAASFARSLQALAKARGAQALSEAAPGRVLAALEASGGDAGDPVKPESFEALAPLLQQGVLAAAGGQRALAARALAALARRTEPQTLAAHAVKCAGPLVRGLGEKGAAAELQEALVSALEALLASCPQALRPLAPALQTSLVKLLESPDGPLRSAAARAIGALAPAAARPEPLIKSLGKQPLSPARLDALAAALRALGGRHCAAEVVREAQAAVDAAGADADEEVRCAGARVASVLCGQA